MPVAGSQSIESRAQPNKRIVIFDGSRLVDPSPHYRSPDFNLANDSQSTGVRSENQASTQRFSYTVPTGQRAHIRADIIIIPQVLATSITVTDIVGGDNRVFPVGGSVQIIHDLKVASALYTLTNLPLFSWWEGWLAEGDIFSQNDEFIGDAAGAGRILINLGHHIEEFNV